MTETSKQFEEAKELLSKCFRIELRDHAFGAMEVSFYLKTDIIRDPASGTWAVREVADEHEGVKFMVQVESVGDATFGCGSGDGIYLKLEEAWVGFDVKESRELMKLSELLEAGRNDETGPDKFEEGACLPVLTLEGVRKELTGG